MFGLAIDHADAGYFASVGIKDQTVHHAVRAESHATGFFGGGERGIQAAEIRAGDATAVANSTVVAGGAAAMNASQYGGAADGHHAAVVETFWQGFLDDEFGAGHFHGR